MQRALTAVMIALFLAVVASAWWDAGTFNQNSATSYGNDPESNYAKRLYWKQTSSVITTDTIIPTHIEWNVNDGKFDTLQFAATKTWFKVTAGQCSVTFKNQWSQHIASSAAWMTSADAIYFDAAALNEATFNVEIDTIWIDSGDTCSYFLMMQ